MWLTLASRILAHTKASGDTDTPSLAVITPCNGSARQITDAVAELALRVFRANALSQNSSALTTGVE